MSVADEIRKTVRGSFADQWNQIETSEIPSPTDVRLGANEAKYLSSATVLYADLDGSTDMVDTMTWTFAAEIYKTFLYSAAHIAQDEGGTVTAYDGDRVMAVFANEDNKNTSAVRAALRINTAVRNVINPGIAATYKNTSFRVKHVIGIDTSPLRAARTGVWGNNDLVWVGRAANYAAKLSDIAEGFQTLVTSDVYDRLNDSVKYAVSGGHLLWTPRTWTKKGITVWGSTGYWTAL